MKRLLFMIIPVLLVLIAFKPAEPIVVTGHVTNSKGAAITNVTVAVKGTATSVATATDGSYSITAPDKKSLLVFTYVGFTGKVIKIKGRSVIDVVLTESEEAMSEVVVVGYGTTKRRSFTGAATTIRGKAIGTPGSSGYIAASPSRIAHDGVDEYEIGRPGPGFNTEDYDHITENRFVKTTDQPLSTFSIDVDAASYSNIRRIVQAGQLPPAGAVRIEEMVNYFKYDYSQPSSVEPFAIHTEMSAAPWNSAHRLVLVGLQGKIIPTENLPASNLVFLIDVSGSMDEPAKLGLVKSSMKMLAHQLREQDRVSMVVYAGAAGLVLEPTAGTDQKKISQAIDRLSAGGSTAGGAGLKLAYKTAREQFIKGGNNRVILCTDGDFNVGESSDDAMETLIGEERKSGVFLTVLGYGMGNYKDNKMQKLADKGNGNHAYIDGISEARRVLVSEFGGTLFTIAKDVKLQVEFNPAKVQGYRLIGYENRMLSKEDFNDDRKDAGELGSGHTVTALYEVIPAGVSSPYLKDIKVDPLKYGKNEPDANNASATNEIMTIKFRYKEPDGELSKLITHPVADQPVRIAATSDNFRFAASVAEFGMILRGSEFKSDASYSNVLAMAAGARGLDKEGYRSEFIRLVQDAESLVAAKPGEDKEPKTVRN